MRKPALPLDDRGQIPGQMSIEETEEMAEGPRKASRVEAQTTKTRDELRRQKTAREVQGRIARRMALKKAGADVPTSNPDLHAKLEDSLGRIERKVTDRSRTQKLVQDRLKDKP
jgi:hypothetical protein